VITLFYLPVNLPILTALSIGIKINKALVMLLLIISRKVATVRPKYY